MICNRVSDISLFKILCCAFLLCSLPWATDAQEDNKLVLRIEPTPGSSRNTEGSFLTLKNGNIVYAVTQFYISAEDSNKSRIVAIESKDNGTTWSNKAGVLVRNFDGVTFMSPSLLRLHNGEIALFYLVITNLHNCRPFVKFSSDEAQTWTRPVPILTDPGYYVVNNDRVIQLESGRLVAPIAYHRSIYTDGEIAADWRGIAMWLLSDDDGRTWKEADSWWSLPVEDQFVGFQEPGVVEVGDGTLFSWARTNFGAQYGFWSDDEGKTFSPPESTTLITPHSPASIKRIPGTTDLLAVYNDHSGRFTFFKDRRTPLVAAISQDGGKTWPIAKVIEGRLNGYFFNTAIHFVDDSVLLAYNAWFLTGDTTSGNRPIAILIRKVSLDWMYADKNKADSGNTDKQ